MKNDAVDPEKIRDEFMQSICDKIREEQTPKQKKFFKLPEIALESQGYVLRLHGTQAWLSAYGEAIQIGWIHTDETERGKGHASQLLRRICSLADEIGVTLSLKAQPKARKIGLVEEQLVEWYRRHGFEGDQHRMTRPPQ